jgi:pyruvate kinase
LRAAVLAVQQAIEAAGERERARIEAALPKHQPSALNLAHYLALRKLDIRRLQLELAALGLSSLGRSEGHVRDALLRLSAWLSPEPSASSSAGDTLDRTKAEARLHANTRALFGPRPSDRHVYIMVTAPDAAQSGEPWADAILQAGADLLRINGAHDSPEQWLRMAATFKARAAALGKPGRVFVDLPGPKLRTEVRQLEEAVLHFPRHKDRQGRTIEPTPVELVAEYREGAEIPVPPQWLPELAAGDIVSIDDAGGRRRSLVVRGPGPHGVAADCDRSLYVTAGLALTWRRGDALLGEGLVGALPRQPRELRLDAGDAFVLNQSGSSEDAAPALALAEPGILAALRPGERVILDDGRLVAVIEAARADGLLCRVQRALKSPTRLRSGKGVCFPDSTLSLATIGPQDEAALAFALEHADGVAASFVHTAHDVATIAGRIEAAARPDFGLILKLETRAAMRNLPEILFEALKHDPVGLMIARGDLAVEMSFERLAEMQEELLWFGEACHLPVIWATEVLDTVAHTGVPTRAEVTDAAMSMRAECVMLNKGPHLAAAVRMLADIIRKMEKHQFKKRSLYRPLALARAT